MKNRFPPPVENESLPIIMVRDFCGRQQPLRRDKMEGLTGLPVMSPAGQIPVFRGLGGALCVLGSVLWLRWPHSLCFTICGGITGPSLCFSTSCFGIHSPLLFHYVFYSWTMLQRLDSHSRVDGHKLDLWVIKKKDAKLEGRGGRRSS